jgi:zinc dependent phospholipase C
MSGRTVCLLRAGSLALAAVAILIVPATAHAWGPLAHLSFAGQALAQLPQTGSPLRSLLAAHPADFLYGSLAADIVVGKNLAAWVHHCHNWQTGFRVLRAARSHAARAFAWGFLGHLAADTVAHNYYVPWKKVSSFHAPRTRHAYWELRYEQQMDPALTDVARAVTVRRLRRHDALLAAELREGCVLPFPLSRGLFGSMLASARAPRFQAFSRFALAPHRRLALEDDLVAETERLAVAAILDLLVDGEASRAARSDPTGTLPLGAARLLRRGLSRQRPAGARELVLETRAAFRHAVDGPLVLPAAAAKLAA